MRSEFMKLFLGTTKFWIPDDSSAFEYSVEYKGLIDSNGKAYGQGVATRTDNSDLTYTGTFKDGRPHGLGKYKCCKCVLSYHTIL